MRNISLNTFYLYSGGDNQSINQYYFIMAWQNAGPQFVQIKNTI